MARPTSSSIAATCIALLAEAVRREKSDAIHLGAPASASSRDAGHVTLHLADGRTRAWPAADRRRRGAFPSARESVRRRPAGIHGLHGLARRHPSGSAARWRIPLAGTNWHRARAATSCTIRCGAANCSISSAWSTATTGGSNSWTAQGTHDECRADFAGWHEEARAIVEAIDTPLQVGTDGCASR